MGPFPVKGFKRSIQRRFNLLNLLEAASFEPKTVQELAIEIGISRPATEAVIADLTRLGWLQELEPAKSIGRPAVRWATRKDAIYVVGAHLSALGIATMLCDYFGNVVTEHSIPLSENLPTTKRLDAAAQAIRETVNQAGILLQDVSICAVGVPGVIHEGVVQHYSGRGMPGWAGVDVESELHHRLGITVMTCGDCPLGALGEAWKGSAVGHDDVVYVLAGPSRICASTIIGGRVRSGYRGSAGIIGELHESRWRQVENLCYGSDGPPEGEAGHDELFEKARTGDQQCLVILDDFSSALATGTAAMILACGPSLVVIGGRFANHVDTFLDKFMVKLEELCPIMPGVTTSELGMKAVPIGAVRAGLQIVSDAMRQQAIESDTFPTSRFRPPQGLKHG